MDLGQGFQIEEPSVFVPWRTSEEELHALLPTLDKVTRGYFVVECVSLGGLRHMLGLHLDFPGGRLVELEFFRQSYPDQRASFDEFQRHLEATFGSPARSGPGDEGFPWYEWTQGGAMVRHFVFDRFGPEEHVRIIKN